jgi:hypothetical protein
MLIQFLAGRDVECPGCKYNLRDQQNAVCPECGEQIALGLHMIEPRQAAPLTGLIGLSLGAGFNGLLLLTITIVDGVGADDRVLHWTAPGVVVSAILLLIWLRQWRRLRRLSQSKRWWLAMSCWALTLCDVIAFATELK